MIHYIEVQSRQAHNIGIDYESYYANLKSMFSSVIRLFSGKEKKHADQILPRLTKIAKTTIDAYGFRDTLEDILDKLTDCGDRV